MKRILILLLTLILCAASFAGCAGKPAAEASSAATSEAAGDEAVTKIIVGLDDTFAPMGFRDEAGELTGFDIDLAKAVGEELGIEIQFQPIDWDAKEMELESRSIDCIWNGMSRTPEREQSMTLSQNYFNNKIIVMTAPGVEISSREQLADFQIGTQAKSASLEILQADETYYEAIKGNLHEYRTYDECILDIQAGRVDAMVVDEMLGQYKNKGLETKLGVAGFDFGDDMYCIGFRKGDDALCKTVEDGIKAVIASGKGKEISEKWFGENLLLEMK